MSEFTFSFHETSLLSSCEVESLLPTMTEGLQQLYDTFSQGFATPEGSVLSMPFEEDYLKKYLEIASQIQQIEDAFMLVIGMGGSIVGTKALYGVFDEANGIELLFLDSLDQRFVSEMIELVDIFMKEGRPGFLNIVSKSGTTTETVINGNQFLALFKRYYGDDYKKYVFFTTDQDSCFDQFAKNVGFIPFYIPSELAGRFSVFSAGSLFPLLCAGINCRMLLKGAQDTVHTLLNQDIRQNNAALSAIIRFLHYHKGRPIHDLFIFDERLLGIGEWYRQLIAESLGKQETVDKIAQYIGITPTISRATADLHSVFQLYMAGPSNRFTQFLMCSECNTDLIIQDGPLLSCVPFAKGKSFHQINEAIFEGVLNAYVQQGRPFTCIELPEITEKILGQLLQWYMIEVIFLAHLLQVNPFNQPHVELYKQFTRKSLE